MHELDKLPQILASTRGLSKEDLEIIASWLVQKGDKTKIYYLKTIQDFFSYFQGRGIREISTVQLSIYLKIVSKEKKDSTVNKVKFALSSLLTYASKIGYIPRNPALALDRIKVPDRTFSKILSANQVKLMILAESDNTRNQLILRTLYNTGVRVEELSNLIVASFRDTELGPMLSLIGKGNKARTIRVSKALMRDLESFWEKEGYKATDSAFKSSKAPFQKLTTVQIWRIVKTAAVKAKIKAKPSPHFFRHSNAAHAVENGAPLHVVQKSLGHESIATTGKYMDITPKESNSDYLEDL